MKEKMEKLIENLQAAIADLEKVESHAYGYKSAAVRARKAMHQARNKLQELRKEVQTKKNLG
jgi:chromosome segregation ATPase